MSWVNVAPRSRRYGSLAGGVCEGTYCSRWSDRTCGASLSVSIPDPRVPSRVPVEQTARHQVGNRRIGWRALAERLRKIERETPPFASVPRVYQRGARWVDPRLVAEVTFTTWTTDNLLRHPSFQGLREDKPAKDVRLERPR
jgi:hypothetical protein